MLEVRIGDSRKAVKGKVTQELMERNLSKGIRQRLGVRGKCFLGKEDKQLQKGAEQVRPRARSPEPLGPFPKSESSASLGDPHSVVLGQDLESVCKSLEDAYELVSKGNTCVSDGDPRKV